MVHQVERNGKYFAPEEIKQIFELEKETAQ